MKKKEKIYLIIFALLNLILTIFLTIYVLPKNVPLLLDVNEKIISFQSKWFMLICAILPSIFAVLLFLLKNKKLLFFIKILYVISLFENFLFFSYFIVEKNITIGEKSAIPISISVFMPISVIISILAIKLKNAPYLSKPAINFKVTKETDFIWKQTHFYAKDAYFLMGIIMFFTSIIFSILRYCLIEFAIFVILIIAFTINVYLYSKSIYNKYAEMKEKQDKLNKESLNKNNNVNEINKDTTKNSKNLNID